MDIFTIVIICENSINMCLQVLDPIGTIAIASICQYSCRWKIKNDSLGAKDESSLNSCLSKFWNAFLSVR